MTALPLLVVPTFLLLLSASRAQRDRVYAYLDHTTLRPLHVLVDLRIISAHAADIVERGFTPLVAQARIVDLRRMFSLLSRVNRCVKNRHLYSLL